MFFYSIITSMSMYDSKHRAWTKLMVLLGLALAFVIGLFVDILTGVPKLPTIIHKQWGPKNDSNIYPYRINVSEEVLADLKYRLTHARIANSTTSINHEYGFNENLLKELLDFWIDEYNWRERENILNKYPHYKTVIQGLDVHFIHVKPPNVNTVPLLLLHGWPNSFRDFYGLIPLLTGNGDDFAFELIIPSLPGYVYSDEPNQITFGGPDYALLFKNLMKRLGHQKFYVYGFDWGSLVATDMATLFPNNVLGIYTPMCISFRWISFVKLFIEDFLPKSITPNEFKTKYMVTDSIINLWKHAGYMHMHQTKPDTISAGLNDSPVGLAAYVLQIVSVATDLERNMYKFDAGLKEYFNYEDILDTVMLYWTSNSITSALRSYVGMFNQLPRMHQIPISKEVPCSCPVYPHEIYYQSNWIRKDKYTNIVQSTVFKKGGHFALIEKEPSIIKEAAQDIYSFVKKTHNSLTM